MATLMVNLLRLIPDFSSTFNGKEGMKKGGEK